MSSNRFRYFRDPDNFAFRVDAESPCSACGENGVWFDVGGLDSENRIESICDHCLSIGKLKDFKVKTNDASEGTADEIETITYKTPPLPTWQDISWPYVCGEYCVFERLASKEDFRSEEEFQASFSLEDRENSDLDWLWGLLADRKIANHRDGNFDVSVYLFTYQGRKYCTWDAS